MATHSTILAGKITWTEQAGQLLSMQLQRNWTQLTEHMTNDLITLTKPPSKYCVFEIPLK